MSLQEAFKQFRDRKLRALRNEAFVKQQFDEKRTSPTQKKHLRRRFIECARSYYGVPYHKKYLKPEDPLYNAPLFLDCCALVRQCVNDLKEEFGFTLGPWNQAYQFDTLPIRKASHTELEPGDLIFYAATYYSTKAKKQRHDMVHVEIFVGGETGEQSIGARWQSGKVQQFDSYKFVSKLYHDITHYYCSLDTWLEGVCKSFCADHEWKRLAWLPGAKSIFALEAEAKEIEAGYDSDGAEDASEPTEACACESC
eukprot:TRINITY_DN12830_c0_g1_i1.p1 TRINITY_DN12830_c0_g1~~TRINITY_DN12830_c0_g1_i1.p1  ORF type:complete len:254 (-),score=25.28 TRINITY_DN12830_c0_g1_i1:648-1409(-)